jgi:hypothetical protein
LASPLWSRRLIEWSIVVAVLIALIWVLEHQARVVQGQGEKVAIRSTLASLRAGLVIDQLMSHVRPAEAGGAAKVKNPFSLMQGVTTNFAGELAMRNIYSVPPGSWVFDPECGCVGYRLLYPQWLEPAQEAGAIWFRVGGAEGEVRLAPLAGYFWFGQRLN